MADPAGRDATAPEVETVARALMEALDEEPTLAAVEPYSVARFLLARLDEVRAAGRAECPTCGGQGTYVDGRNEVQDCATCGEGQMVVNRTRDVIADFLHGGGPPLDAWTCACEIADVLSQAGLLAEFSGAPEGSNDGE